MTNENDYKKIKNAWTPEQYIQGFKEVVTAFLGVMIVLCTLILAGLTFTYAGDPAKIANAKDILQVLLGVAGVVIGYYFGRVPADARAAQAQEQANAATAQSENVHAQSQVVVSQVEQIMDKITPAVDTDRSIVSGQIDMDITADLQRIRDNLRALLIASRTYG